MSDWEEGEARRRRGGVTIRKGSIKLWAVVALAVLAATVLARIDGAIQLIDYSGAPGIEVIEEDQVATSSSDPEWRYVS